MFLFPFSDFTVRVCHLQDHIEVTWNIPQQLEGYSLYVAELATPLDSEKTLAFERHVTSVMVYSGRFEFLNAKALLQGITFAIQRLNIEPKNGTAHDKAEEASVLELAKGLFVHSYSQEPLNRFIEGARIRVANTYGIIASMYQEYLEAARKQLQALQDRTEWSSEMPPKERMISITEELCAVHEMKLELFQSWRKAAHRRMS